MYAAASSAAAAAAATAGASHANLGRFAHRSLVYRPDADRAVAAIAVSGAAGSCTTGAGNLSRRRSPVSRHCWPESPPMPPRPPSTLSPAANELPGETVSPTISAKAETIPNAAPKEAADFTIPICSTSRVSCPDAQPQIVGRLQPTITGWQTKKPGSKSLMLWGHSMWRQQLPRVDVIGGRPFSSSRKTLQPTIRQLKQQNVRRCHGRT